MDHASLMEKLARVGRTRVVLVGDFMLDEYVYGDVERINPEAPVPVLRVVRGEQRLGGAGRVAADLAALGASVCCVGMIGNDDGGACLRRQLDQLGCDTSCMAVTPDRPTTVKTRLVGLAQHRHPQQLLRVDREDTGPADVLTKLLADGRIDAHLDNADVLVLQDYNKGFLAAESIAALIKAARRRRVPVLVDPALLSDYSRYRGATLITPNRYEASLAADEQIGELQSDSLPSGGGPGRGDGAPDTSQLFAVSARLIAKADLDYVVLTLDKEGIYLGSRDGTGTLIPTRPRTIYDVTGAGDMVLAVLGVCWGQAGLLPVEAVALSNMAAGLEVEKFGSVPISREELLAEVHASVRGRSKLWDLPALVREMDRLRKDGKRIAFTNGCFDILHPGHVQYLQFSREQGDVLIVGLNSDSSVKRNKGPSRPICTEQERAAVLSALACVDYIVVFDEDTPHELVKAIQPDRLIKGAQWAGNVVGS
ncbi:MAG: bifunctional heptose 7-phosphate kinase/heptose 1-phosphate adenyltransferase, partial [Phycisphaerae bacterium]|nr:bifunctional heptose 7-phosphate kinase/heptose 1-phosphate adenyltransferase [Phycisphaerae bacterium]